MTHLSSIETAIKERLAAAGLSVCAVDANHDLEGIIKPRINIQPLSILSFDQVSMWKYHANVQVQLIIIFRNVRCEEDRRNGIYPLVEGVIAHLQLADLGEGVGRVIPYSARDITPAEYRKTGFVAYRVELRTKYEIKLSAEETESELLKIGLDYFFKPGDDVKDAEDILEV